MLADKNLQYIAFSDSYKSYNEQVCCIWNLFVTNQKDWEAHQKLSVFLRDNLCQAGTSHKFMDISLLHRYYLEAWYALDLGMQSESTSWDYPFETIILPFFRSQAIRELEPGQLYHPGTRMNLKRKNAV